MILSNGQTLSFAPQALGETVPIAASTGYYYADQGLDILGRFAMYGELYRSQAWLATVIDKVADAAARLSFNVWDNTPASGKTLDLTSPYARLWQRPCPQMPTYAFWRWTQSTYELYGEAFWLKVRGNNGQVSGLLPMHPSRTATRRDKDGNVEYVFTLGVASAGLLTVPEAEVVPFLRYNPENLMRGLSRAESLRSTLLNEASSRRAIESWWKRGARPSLMISAPNALSQAAYDRLAATVARVHGGVDQSGGTLVLEEGAKPVPVQLSAEEMQYISSRQLNREEVCGRYDVPPPVVHILDHATFSNITEQMRSMYRDTMAPRLEDLESTIDHHLRPDFDPTGNIAGRFALDEVLRGDFETRATAVGSLIEKGVMKPSEARPLFDLADAGPVADKLYANAALQELGKPAERLTISAAAAPTPQEVQDAADVEAAAAAAGEAAAASAVTTAPQQSTHSVRRRQRQRRRAHWVGKAHARDTYQKRAATLLTGFFDRQSKAVLSALAAKSADDFWDDERWDSELSNDLFQFSTLISTEIGQKTAASLGFTAAGYDVDRTLAFLRAVADSKAANINATTKAQVAAALASDSADDTPAGVFDTAKSQRAVSASVSLVSAYSGFATTEAARQTSGDKAEKTWITGDNPRPSHEAMDGETVGINDTFSDGSNWPGDGGEDDAGCNCSVEVSNGR